VSEVVPEPGVEPAVEPAIEPAEPAWAPSQDEWQTVTNTLGAVADFVSRQQQVFQPQQPDNGVPPIPDPWNRPDTYAEDFQRYTQHALAPVQQFTQEAALAEAEERAQDILGDLIAKHGEFDKEVAYARANVLLPQMVQRYGQGPKAAEAALEAAAQAQLAYETQVREKAIAQYTNQIKTLAGAPGEPGSTYQVGVQSRTIPDYRAGGSVTDRVFGRGAQRD